MSLLTAAGNRLSTKKRKNNWILTGQPVNISVLRLFAPYGTIKGTHHDSRVKKKLVSRCISCLEDRSWTSGEKVSQYTKLENECIKYQTRNQISFISFTVSWTLIHSTPSRKGKLNMYNYHQSKKCSIHSSIITHPAAKNCTWVCYQDKTTIEIIL